MSSTRVSATAEDEKRDKRSQKRIDKCVETLLSESRDKFDRARLTQVCRMYAETVEDNKKLTASNHQLQQRIDSLLKEKSSLESENSKSLLARTRLEGLCRQLQKQNKQVKEEHTARLRGEEERRREAAGKFQTTLSEITSLMTNNEKRYAWLTEDNRVMSDKLKELLSKYDDNNSAVELLIKQKDLEYQLAESRLVKLQQESAKEKKDMLLEKHTMLTELNQCQARCLQLHEQLKLYSENYDRAQSNMSQSDKMISNFKSDMNKMQKNVKRMEKETSVWRGRCEVTGNKLASLSSTNSDLQHRLTVSDRKVATLEKLCRALHSLKLPAEAA